MFLLFCDLAYGCDYLPHLLLRHTRFFFSSVSLQKELPICFFPLYILEQQELGCESLVQTECLHIEFTSGIYRKLWYARKKAIGSEEAKVKRFVSLFIKRHVCSSKALQMKTVQLMDFLKEVYICLLKWRKWFIFWNFVMYSGKDELIIYPSTLGLKWTGNNFLCVSW